MVFCMWLSLAHLKKKALKLHSAHTRVPTWIAIACLLMLSLISIYQEIMSEQVWFPANIAPLPHLPTHWHHHIKEPITRRLWHRRAEHHSAKVRWSGRSDLKPYVEHAHFYAKALSLHSKQLKHHDNALQWKTWPISPSCGRSMSLHVYMQCISGHACLNDKLFMTYLFNIPLLYTVVLPFLSWLLFNQFSIDLDIF